MTTTYHPADLDSLERDLELTANRLALMAFSDPARALVLARVDALQAEYDAIIDGGVR